MKHSTNPRQENHPRRRRNHHRQFPPNQDMINYPPPPPPPPLPSYGFSSPSLLHYQNHPVLLDETIIYGYQPYYSFSIGPLQYHYADFDVLYRRQGAVNFVPRTWEYEENQRERVESSLGGSNWVQESADALSNISVRATYRSEEEIVVFDLFPGLNSFSEELGVQGSSSNGDNLLVEEAILQRMKTRNYQTPLSGKQVGGEEDAEKQVEGLEDAEICVVCQSEYENEELLGILGCGHEYHANCIKRWLMRKNFCPVCKRTAIDQESRI